MVLASVVAIWTDAIDSPTNRTHPPYMSPPVLVDFNGFGLIFSGKVIKSSLGIGLHELKILCVDIWVFNHNPQKTVGLFSQLFQHSVPNLIQPLQVSLVVTR